MWPSVLRFFIYFILFSSLFDIRSSDCRNSSGQERKMLYSTRATREYKKTRDFAEILIKYSKNPNFWDFLRSTAF